MTRDWKGELGSNKKQKMKELHEKYRVKKKGLKTVIEELKQRMVQRFERGREREREGERDRERQRESKSRVSSRNSDHKCCKNKETMQKDWKAPGRDDPQGYWTNQEPQQSTQTYFLTSE